MKRPYSCSVLLLGLLATAIHAEDAPKSTQAPAGESAAPTFDIYEFQIDGNSVLESRDIEKLVYPMLGPGKTIADVEKAQTVLEQAYRDAGYATVRVDIPEQDVKENVVHLQVVEATIDRMRIKGSRYFSLGHIRESLPALAEGKVPHMPSIQQQLTEFNKASADRTITPVARAGQTPGTTEWELKVEDKLPLHASVEMNSRNTPTTTYTRMAASVRYDNLWQKYHSISMQYQTSPQNNNEVEVIAGTYVMPLWDGWKAALYGVGTNSTNFAAVLGGSTILGAGQIYGLRLIKPLPETKDYFHTFTVGVDYKDFGQNTFSPIVTSSAPATYAPFTARYDGTWKHDEGQTVFGIEANVLFRGMGNSQEEFTEKRSSPDTVSANKKKPGARTDYAYLGVDFEHRQKLPYDTLALGRMSGQVASGMLINNEQFTSGGMRSVRGYHEVEVLGDHGVSGSLEFYTPKLAMEDWDFADELRALVFLDAARASVIHQTNQQPNYYDIASSGAGLKWQLWKHFNGELYWSYPFSKTEHVNPGNQRVDFRVLLDY